VRGYLLESYSGPAALTLQDLPEPTPADDELVLEVAAIGVNFPDLLMTRGQYQHRPDPPVTPGCEVAGTVVHAPAGSRWQVGDRAAAFVWDGGFAERVRVPTRSAAPVPDSLDLESAAAMIVNYQTAHFALERRGAVRAGETVLVLGAGGGIGTASVQVAKGLGARVLAGVADEAQVATAREAGADDVLVLEEGYSAVVLDRTEGAGVDAVVDPLGDWLFDEAVRCLAPEGRLLVVGFAAGAIPQVKVNRLLLRNASVVGVAWGAFLDREQDLIVRQAASLAAMAEAGHVRPVLHRRFAFEELPAALEDLGAGRIRGKAVVLVGQG